MKIYVGHLSFNITEDELREVFAEHGEVSSVTLITDKHIGQSLGFGFIEMPVPSEAQAAIQSLDGHSVNGRDIKVTQARPRIPRPLRRPRY